MTQIELNTKTIAQIENEIGHKINGSSVERIHKTLYFKTVSGTDWYCNVTLAGNFKKNTCHYNDMRNYDSRPEPSGEWMPMHGNN